MDLAEVFEGEDRGKLLMRPSPPIGLLLLEEEVTVATFF